jgi:hypothetical protein
VGAIIILPEVVKEKYFRNFPCFCGAPLTRVGEELKGNEQTGGLSGKISIYSHKIGKSIPVIGNRGP